MEIRAKARAVCGIVRVLPPIFASIAPLFRYPIMSILNLSAYKFVTIEDGPA